MQNPILEKLTTDFCKVNAGRGAYRATAVLLPIMSNESVPVERLKELTVDWEVIEGELVPQIRLTFYDGESRNPTNKE